MTTNLYQLTSPSSNLAQLTGQTMVPWCLKGQDSIHLQMVFCSSQLGFDYRGRLNCLIHQRTSSFLKGFHIITSPYIIPFHPPNFPSWTKKWHRFLKKNNNPKNGIASFLQRDGHSALRWVFTREILGFHSPLRDALRQQQRGFPRALGDVFSLGKP